MRRLSFATVAAAMLVFAASPLHAQGCVDSPEAPTAVLMLIGAAGVMQGSNLVKRFGDRLRGR